jgi:hypothetical protein
VKGGEGAMRKLLGVLVLAFAVIGGLSIMGCSKESPLASDSGNIGRLSGPGDAVSTGQSSVEVVVYNQDLGLVREKRKFKLEKGLNELRFTDVPTLIDPTSVHFKCEGATVLEQNYEYDLVDTSKILSKYIDQVIKIIAKDGTNYSGRLLSFDGSSIVLRLDDGSILSIQRENVRDIQFPSLPEGLITKPTLVWLVDSKDSGEKEVEVTYLTKGMTWHTEYVALLSEDDTKMDLAGWVTVENRCGATFKDASLKLVAGEIKKVEEVVPVLKDVLTLRPEGGFEETPFFEYHLYVLKGTTTIKNNQMKQIELMNVLGVPVNKIYTFDATKSQNRVSVSIEFVNDEKSGLGIPLPAGKIRVYKFSSDFGTQFVGEDKIGHTPKHEKLTVEVGKAFDLVASRSMTSAKSLGTNSREESYEITLRNRKNVDVTIVVIEHLWGWAEWEIVSSSMDYVKRDASTIEFRVPVPKDKEVKVSYTVRYRW